MPTDNIINFPDRRRGSGVVTFPKAQWQIENSLKRAARLRTIRESTQFPPPYDVVWPAMEVDRLLREAKKRKIPRAKIADLLRAVAGAAGRKPYMHWERLRPSETKKDAKTEREVRADIDKRAPSTNALSKDVQDYVNLLEALADALGYERDDVLYSAFERTKIGTTQQSAPPSPAERLLVALQEVAGSIAASHNLADYFDRASQVNGEFNIVSGDIARWDCALLSGLTSPNNRGGFLNEVDVAWHPLPFPRVPLLRVFRHGFSGPILVSSRRIANATCDTSEVARLASPCSIETWKVLPLPLSQFRSLDAELELYAELRLVIAPRQHSKDIRPMLECGTFVQLKTEDCIRPLTFPHSIIPLSSCDDEDGEVNAFVGSVAAQFDDGWRRVTGVNRRTWEGIGELAPHFGGSLDSDVSIKSVLGSEGYEFIVGWHPLSLDTVAALLDVVPEATFLPELDGPDPRPTEIWSANCAPLQTCIFTGALQKALAESCDRLETQLSERIAESQSTIEREFEALMGRIQSKASSATPKD